MSRPPLSRAAAGKLLADAFGDWDTHPMALTPKERWQQAAAALLEAAGCPLAAAEPFWWGELLDEENPCDPVSVTWRDLKRSHNLRLAAERRIAAALAELTSGGHTETNLCGQSCRSCRAAALLRGEGGP